LVKTARQRIVTVFGKEGLIYATTGGKMSKLHINHLKSGIRGIFDGKISLDDIKKTFSSDEKERFFLTRGLAAYSLCILAGLDPDGAAAAVVDGYDDNGIDAIHFDKVAKLLWIVQSKWINDGKGGPDNGEVKKFRDGIRDLIELDFQKFNTKVRSKSKEIQDALNDHEVKLRIIIAYTGNQFSIHAKRDMDELMAELNDPTELAAYHEFNLADAHKALAGGTGGQPINLVISLTDWGQVDEPIKAIYGVVNAQDIAAWWINYHRRLFGENIRSFIGSNEVNDSIQKTLNEQPEHFWYFNNGITLLSKKITKAAVGGSDKSIGVFHCEGASIVNGAQTVGNIGEVHIKGKDVGKAKVLVRLISLEGTPEKFSQQITKATNTQNRIEKRDFVTQDIQQERLSLELKLLDNSVNYHYIRSDESIALDDSNCTLEEATIALACANPDVDLAVLAKRELGRLWDDLEDKSKPYHQLFNDNLSGLELWQTVKIMREVSYYLKTFEDSTIGRKRSIYIHANRFLLHMVFYKLPFEYRTEPNFVVNLHRQEIETLLDLLVEKVFNIVEQDYAASLVHQIFRNFTKCRDIKNKIITQSI
jgi:hypothetical protein